MSNESLFPEMELELEKKLIWQGTSSTHTKAQKEFNEALNKHREAVSRAVEVESFLAIANQAYMNQIVPEINKRKALEKKRVEVMCQIYLENKVRLGKRQREFLRELILDICNEDLESDRDFYTFIIDQLETKLEKNERLAFKRTAEKEIKKKFGIDIDLDELNRNDFKSDEDRAEHHEKYREFKEKFDEYRASFGDDFFGNAENSRKKKKSKAQIEKEKKITEAEKLLGMDINKLFKSLAKLIHPDKEQDPILRAKKANLMTDLSNARDNMNIAGILQIKMQVDELIPDNETEMSFNDTSIKRFVSIIKAKISELESTISQKLFSHPIFESFNIKKINMESLKKHIAKVVKETVLTTKEYETEVNHLIADPKFIKVIIEIEQDFESDF